MFLYFESYITQFFSLPSNMMMLFVQEKKTLQGKLDAALAENESYKVKLYDALKKVEESQKVIRDLSAEIVTLNKQHHHV